MNSQSYSGIVIRQYEARDRNTVRKICTDTAFMGRQASAFFNGDKIMADVLCGYFTDYEPESCFVAESDGCILGYVNGARDIMRMRYCFILKILLEVFIKALFTGILFHSKNITFFYDCAVSFFKGEFFKPDFGKEYPAVLHINLAEGARGMNIGQKLMERYLLRLKNNNVKGVQCSTVSDKAKDFFAKQGFSVLWRGRVSYLKRYSGRTLNSYVLGLRFF